MSIYYPPTHLYLHFPSTPSPLPRTHTRTGEGTGRYLPPPVASPVSPRRKLRGSPPPPLTLSERGGGIAPAYTFLRQRLHDSLAQQMAFLPPPATHVSRSCHVARSRSLYRSLPFSLVALFFSYFCLLFCCRTLFYYFTRPLAVMFNFLSSLFPSLSLCKCHACTRGLLSSMTHLSLSQTRPHLSLWGAFQFPFGFTFLLLLCARACSSCACVSRFHLLV